MNFFGHSVVASWRRGEPGFALGAMLPDLATMIGQRDANSSDPLVGAGVEFHHETDRVFHQGSTFVELQRAARTELTRRGVSRPVRLAVAHVGLELILDAELARAPETLDRYLEALEALEARAVRDSLTFRGPSAGTPHAELDELCRRLFSRRHRLCPQDPDELFDRLQRILMRRPALQPKDQDRASIVAWAGPAWDAVATRIPLWRRELQSGLGLLAERTGANVGGAFGQLRQSPV